jgi:hypothetical protein
VVKLLLNPKLFNLIIMALYLLAAIRWAIQRSWADVWYWAFALGITAVVTFGYRHA